MMLRYCFKTLVQYKTLNNDKPCAIVLPAIVVHVWSDYTREFNPNNSTVVILVICPLVYKSNLLHYV